MNRHVEVMGSFGGNAILKEAVIIKCTNGIKDHVSNWLLYCSKLSMLSYSVSCVIVQWLVIIGRRKLT